MQLSLHTTGAGFHATGAGDALLNLRTIQPNAFLRLDGGAAPTVAPLTDFGEMRIGDDTLHTTGTFSSGLGGTVQLQNTWALLIPSNGSAVVALGSTLGGFGTVQGSLRNADGLGPGGPAGS